MRFIFILAALAAGCANVDKATDKARKYAADNFPGAEVVNIQCESWDSDGNGRVRCNISLREAGSTHVEHVDCPSSYLPQFATYCVGLKR